MAPTDRPRLVADGCDNYVFLRGRLAAEPIDRELPSGDLLTTFRITVRMPAGERVPVDSLDCASLKALVRRRLLRAQEGDTIEVTGSLQRRFYRVGAAAASRYTVSVESLTVLKAGRRGAAARAPKPASA